MSLGQGTRACCAAIHSASRIFHLNKLRHAAISPAHSGRAGEITARLESRASAVVMVAAMIPVIATAALVTVVTVVTLITARSLVAARAALITASAGTAAVRV